LSNLAIIDDIATHGLSVCDGFLSAQEVHDLHTCLPAQWAQATIGREQKQHTNTQIRRDKIHWLERGSQPAVDALLAKMADLQQAFNRHLFFGGYLNMKRILPSTTLVTFMPNIMMPSKGAQTVK
jgi:hypothetical protein